VPRTSWCEAGIARLIKHSLRKERFNHMSYVTTLSYFVISRLRLSMYSRSSSSTAVSIGGFS
jgi:hypothetical protein